MLGTNRHARYAPKISQLKSYFLYFHLTELSPNALAPLCFAGDDELASPSPLRIGRSFFSRVRVSQRRTPHGRTKWLEDALEMSLPRALGLSRLRQFAAHTWQNRTSKQSKTVSKRLRDSRISQGFAKSF